MVDVDWLEEGARLAMTRASPPLWATMALSPTASWDWVSRRNFVLEVMVADTATLSGRWTVMEPAETAVTVPRSMSLIVKPDLVRTMTSAWMDQRRMASRPPVVAELVRAVTRPTADARLALNLRPVDVETVVGEVVAAFGPTATEYGLTIAAVPNGAGAEGPALALADRDRLGQVLANLVENAAGFAEHQVVVRINPTAPGAAERRASRDDQGVAVEVEDDGPGITPADQDRVLQRFAQVDQVGPAGTWDRGWVWPSWPSWWPPWAAESRSPRPSCPMGVDAAPG